MPGPPGDSGSAGTIACGEALGGHTLSLKDVPPDHPEVGPHLIPVGLSRVPVDACLGFIYKVAKGIHLQGAVQTCRRVTQRG